MNCLSRGDFADLTAQLEGLISIYQLNAEKKVKCKAYSALCAVESDLVSLWTAQSNIKDAQTLLNKSPVGILEKRRGGLFTYVLREIDLFQSSSENMISPIFILLVYSNVRLCLS